MNLPTWNPKTCSINKKIWIYKKHNKVQKHSIIKKRIKCQAFIQKTIVRKKNKKWNCWRNKIISLKRKLTIFNCVYAKSKWNWTGSNSPLMKNLTFSKSTRKSWRNSNLFLNPIDHHRKKFISKISPYVNSFQKRRKCHNFLTFLKPMV